MTRINLVAPELLVDKHLLAEFRELTRIPNCIISGKLKREYADAPMTYTLGKGHVKFFVDKLGWLKQRYDLLYCECVHRGFHVTPIFPSAQLQSMGIELSSNWTPSNDEVMINEKRIQHRMPANARHTKPRGE